MSAAYRYKGYDSHGRKVEGEVIARTPEEAERRIAAQDVTIIAVLPAGRKGKEGATGTAEDIKVSRKGRKVSDADAAVILRNLAVMVETGVPFVEALDAVAASSDAPANGYLKAMKEEVVGGKSLSRAMREVPCLFQPLVGDMVRVAEEGGRLDHALSSAASYLERSAELRKKIMSAMMYPMVMLSVSFLTVGILIVFVMPRFGAIFTKMKTDLPVTTKLLLSMGTFVRSNPLGTAMIALGVIGVMVLAWRTPASRAAITSLMRRMPGLGDLMKKLALSRAFMSIATLLKANVSMMAALEHGSRVAWDPIISEALMRVRSSVEHGGALSEAMAETKVFPPMLLQMVAVGERTGRLHQLLSTCAAGMEQDVDSRLKSLVALVEPIMIVLMGAIVGTITISIISPIYSVVENIK